MNPTLSRIRANLQMEPSEEETSLRTGLRDDTPILLDADATLRDSEILKTICDCITRRYPGDSEVVIRGLIRNRIGRDLEREKYDPLWATFTPSEWESLVQVLVDEMKLQLKRDYNSKSGLSWDSFARGFVSTTSLVNQTMCGLEFFAPLTEACLLAPGFSSSYFDATNNNIPFREGFIQSMLEVDRSRNNLMIYLRQSSGAGSSEVPYRWWWIPKLTNASPIVLNQILLGVEILLKSSMDFDWVRLWEMTHDILDWRNERKQDSIIVGRIITLVTASIQQETNSSDIPSAHKALVYHEVLSESVQLRKRDPSCLPKVLEEDLETRCLRVFRTTMEAQGYLLTNWDDIPPETFIEDGLWRVKQLRSSCDERYRVLRMLDRGMGNGIVCEGGLLRKPDVISRD